MALSQTQIDQLNVAAGRRTADDIRNVDYAMKTYGYKPPTGYASTPISTAPPVAPTTPGTATNPALTPDKIRELDIASANQNKTATDLANIDYAMKKYGYKAPTTFNASELPKADTTNLNTAPIPKTDTTNDFMARIEENKRQMDEYMKKYAPDTSALDAEKKGLRDKLTSALGNLTGKGKATLAAEQAAGIPENQKRLDEMNMTIAQKTAEFNKATEALSAGTGLTTVIGGKQGQLRRQAAVEMGGLTAVAQALQGNITAARDTVKRTVDLQYEDAEQEIANLKTQLDLNSEDLTAAEKKKAEELKFYLDAKETELAAEKNDRNAILDLATQAAKAGATNAEINAIIATRTLDDAIPMASKYLNESEKTDYYITKDETGLVTAIDKNTGAIVWTQSGGAAQKWASGGSGGSGSGGSGGGGGTSGTDWDKARQFLADNPDAKPEELKPYLQQNTKLSDSEINSLIAERTATAPKKQFISEQYFRNMYGTQLKQMAKDAGYAGAFQWSATEVNNFLKDLMGRVQSYRDAGFSDEEIINKMS